MAIREHFKWEGGPFQLSGVPGHLGAPTVVAFCIRPHAVPSDLSLKYVMTALIMASVGA